MLQDTRSLPPDHGDVVDEGGGLNLDYLLSAARRRARVIIACAVLGLVLGYGYLATAVPLYTANVRLLIESPESNTAHRVSGVAEVTFDSAAVDSQVELIRSEAIAEQVVDALDLSHDPLFMRNRASGIAAVRGWLVDAVTALTAPLDGVVSARPLDPTPDKEPARIAAQNAAATDPADQPGSGEPVLDLVRRKAATWRLIGGLNVSRVNRTFVLNIAYTAPDPGLAAKIANGYANAYLNDQLESKYQATRRASDWLLNRTEELKQQALGAERAIEAFRQDNDLIASKGTLLTDQRFASVNEQLTSARAEVSSIEARYQRLVALIESGETDAVVSETFSQGITSDLRKRYLEAKKLDSEISSLLGPNHAQAVRLRDEMRELQKLMFEEIKRLAQVTKNELEVARQRVHALEQDAEELLSTTAVANETQVQLRELERSAASIRSLYSTFLQRYQESLQTQSFAFSDARIITAAEPPGAPSYPRRQRTLIMALMFGGAVGVGFAAFAEYRDRAFRTGDQVRDQLGLEFIGMLPIIAAKSAEADKQRKPRSSGTLELAYSAMAPPSAPEDGEVEVPQWPPLVITNPLMRYVLDEPLSAFAETLRSAKIAADVTIQDEDARIIGIASVLPREGKTTIAKNFASLLARQGAKTLLIDGDLRNPGLTHDCARDAEQGLVEVLTKDIDWASVLRCEADTGLLLLPANVERRVSHTSDLLASPAMRALLTEAQKHFDYIVIDLPPLGPVVDVRAMLPLLHRVLFVIEWGSTNRDVVLEALLDDRRLATQSLGVVLNKVDQDKLRQYGGYDSKYYNYNRYNKYYGS